MSSAETTCESWSTTYARGYSSPPLLEWLSAEMALNISQGEFAEDSHCHTNHRSVLYRWVVQQKCFELCGCDLVAFDLDELLAFTCQYLAQASPLREICKPSNLFPIHNVQ